MPFFFCCADVARLTVSPAGTLIAPLHPSPYRSSSVRRPLAPRRGWKMFGVRAVFAVSLFVVPAVVTADPIPVAAIVQHEADYGASARLDRGASHSNAMTAWNLAGSPFASWRGVGLSLQGQLSGAGRRTTSLASADAGSVAAALASGAYPSGAGINFNAYTVVPSQTATVPGCGPGAVSALSQAFREAFGPLTAAEIDANRLAPIVGAMTATGVMPNGQTPVMIDTGGAVMPVSASEPATLVLLGTGLFALARRQRSKRAARQ